MRGFCHCHPPYYGLGCLKGGFKQGVQQQKKKQRSVQGLVKILSRQQKHVSRSRLKIFIYDLPWHVAFQDGYYPGGWGWG